MTSDKDMTEPGVRTSWPQRFLLLAFGLLLLGLFEVTLRWAGFGGRPPLLLPLEAPAHSGTSGLYEINPRVAAPYFERRGDGGETMVGGHRREVVELPKPEGTIRVLLLGASTVEGFPLPVNLTSSRFLEAMLEETMPATAVEVVNLGITAIASFPLAEIGEIAIEQLDPDLVIVYYGHNEFFGASGVAAHRLFGRSSAGMRLRQSIRSTGVAGLIDLLKPSVEKHPGDQSRHLIEVMAGTSAIEPDGDLHRAARSTLHSHLTSLIEASERRQIPILLSTVVSLERDLAPIASYRLPSRIDDPELDNFESSPPDLQADPTAVLQEIDALVAERPQHAGLAYAKARLFEAAGRRIEADKAYRRARDLDAMPWRASSDKNETIRELARTTDTPLADAERLFAEQGHGATSWELFYDHVHPSLRGQALLAEAFLRAIADERLLPLEREDLGSLPDWRALAGQLGAHPLERYVVLHKMATLFRTPPIGRNNERAAEHFEALLEQQKAGADTIDRQAIELWEVASRRAGFALPISFFAGRVAIDEGETARAAVYLRAAIANAYELSDERAAARVLLLEARLQSGGAAAIEESLDEVRREAQRVRRLPGQPSALLARCLAALETLAGSQDEKESWRLADRLAEGAPPWTQTFLEQIPSQDHLRTLLAHNSPGL